MSIINDDSKPIKKGRQNPLKEVQKEPGGQSEPIEVSLREKIPSNLLAKVNELKLGSKVVDVWTAGNSDRSNWLSRQQEYLSDWDEFLVSSAEGPFQQSSSLHIPMPLTTVKTTHARFMQALLGIDPPFNTKPRNPASVERAELVQGVMDYTLKSWANNHQGVTASLDDWLWDWVTTGVGLLKIRWDRQYTRFRDIEEVPVPSRPEFFVDENGLETMLPTVLIEEQEVTREKLTFEGPVTERVNPEDLLITGGNSPQNADSVIQEVRNNASELNSLADQGIFDREVVNEILRSGPDSMTNEQTDNIKQQRLLNAGRADFDSNAKLDQYRILEAYIKADIDGSGINSDIVLWVHKRSGKVLRATYLYRMNKAGQRPFFKIDFLKRPNQDYGIGLVEMLHPLSVEMDAMHNMRIDFGILSTMPFGFYRPSSSIDPEVIQFEPGSLIPVDNPATDVVFPNLGNRTSFGLQEESSLQLMVERLTGISDLALGVQTSTQGAARTATGARALLGEQNINLDVFLRRLNQGWKQALEFLFHMLQENIPKGLSFRVTGESGNDYWAQIQGKDDLVGDFDIDVEGNTAASNVVLQTEQANLLVQLTSNPLDFQLGIITPLNRYEALKQLIKVKGIKDTTKYLTKPAQIQRILSPEEEANRILAGIPVPISPQMDHEGFMAFAQEIMDSDELLGQFGPEAAVTLKNQQNQHQAMMQALEQAAAQQANSQQVQINSQNLSGPQNLLGDGSE